MLHSDRWADIMNRKLTLPLNLFLINTINRLDNLLILNRPSLLREYPT